MVYEYLDHISDVYVHVASESLEGLFSEAALATFEVMLDPKAVEIRKEVQVDLSAKDLEQLMYVWIDRLLYHFDAEGFALGQAIVKEISLSEGARLSALICGEEYDPAKHDQRTGVKAMTYSLMRIYREGKTWHAYFVLDI